MGIDAGTGLTPSIAPPAPSETGRVSLERARQAIQNLAQIIPGLSPNVQEALRSVGLVLAEAFEITDPEESARLKNSLGLARPDQGEADASRPEPPAVGRAQELLAGEPDLQATAVCEGTKSLVGELCRLDRPEVAAMLLARLSGYLADQHPQRREAAAVALLSMAGAWETTPFSTVREGFESLVRSALDHESEGRVYAKLIDLAVLIVDLRLGRGEFEQALEMVAILRKHSQGADQGAQERSGRADQALKRILSGSGIPRMAEKLTVGDPVAVRMIEALGPTATGFLISEVLKAETGAPRVRLAELLGRIGPEAGDLFAQELGKATAPSDILRLLEVLPYAAREEVALRSLEGLLRHPVKAVRRRAVEILAERAYPRSGGVILQVLREEMDPSLRGAIVEALGLLRSFEALPALSEIAESRDESEEARAQACVALGRLGEAKALSTLLGLAGKSPRGLTGMLRSTPSAVRIGALRGLAFFRSQAHAREALKRGTEDSDPRLQAVAREILEGPGGPTLAEAHHEAVAQDAKSAGLKLAGSLAEISVEHVFQLISGAGKIGLLVVTFEGPVARIWFENGLVTAAEFEGRLDQDAVNEIITRKDGQFSFQPGEFAPKARIRIPVNTVLLEAFRVADEGPRRT